MSCSATRRTMMRLQVMVIAPAWCQVDWAWAGRGPLISLQVCPVSSALCREPWKNGSRFVAARFSRGLVRSSVAWLAGSIGGAAGGGDPSRVALRCYVLCCAVLRCAALARCFLGRGHGSRVKEEEEEEEGEGGWAWPQLASFSMPSLHFPAPSFSASLTLDAPFLPVDPIRPPFSSSTSAWNKTTRLDRRGHSLTRSPACLRSTTASHLHIASPVRHSLRLLLQLLLGPCQVESRANHCTAFSKLLAPPGFTTALGSSRPPAVVLVPLPTDTNHHQATATRHSCH